MIFKCILVAMREIIEIGRRGHRIITYEYIGFVILDNQDDSYYIDLICAKNVGKRLIDEVKSLAARDKKKYIKLSALSNVVMYYRKQGFKNAEKDCNELMQIPEFARQFEGVRFATNEEAINNPDYARFLSFLVNSQLVHDKGCKGISMEGQGCGVNGYSMIYCVPET
jgi:hypothetical protein